MEIATAQVLKKELELSLTKLCRDFETQTGLEIHSVDFQTIKDIGRKKSQIVHMGLDVTI